MNELRSFFFSLTSVTIQDITTLKRDGPKWIWPWIITAIVINSISFPCSAIVDDFVISGFITTGVMTTSTEDATFLSANDDLRFDPLSLVGIQFTAPVQDRTSFTIQFSARGIDEYAPDVKLAFLKMELNEYYDLRAGKLPIPFFMISDYIGISYTYPWVTPPIDVYIQTGFTEFEGLDLIKRQQIGNWSLAIQGFVGSSYQTISVNDFDIKIEVSSIYGANITLTSDLASFRLGHSTGRFSFTDAPHLEAALIAFAPAIVEDQLDISDLDGKFSGIGITSEHENFLFMSEYTMKITNGLVADTVGWYALFGYHFGPVLPHLTFSGITTDEKYNGLETLKVQTPNLANAIEDFIKSRTLTEKSITLGLRYDFRENTALKLEIQHIKIDEGSSGLLQNIVADFNSIRAYSITLDAIF